jgi:hypothetical protein
MAEEVWNSHRSGQKMETIVAYVGVERWQSRRMRLKVRVRARNNWLHSQTAAIDVSKSGFTLRACPPRSALAAIYADDATTLHPPNDARKRRQMRMSLLPATHDMYSRWSH